MLLPTIPARLSLAARRDRGDRGSAAARSAGFALVGVAVLLVIWWIGGWIVASNPATANFAGFAPAPTLARLWRMLVSGEAVRMAIPSLGRIAAGLAWAIAVGVPCGILIGRFRAAREASAVPFQFLRMISPLAWMPIAVMAFSTWNGAIIFLDRRRRGVADPVFDRARLSPHRSGLVQGCPQSRRAPVAHAVHDHPGRRSRRIR